MFWYSACYDLAFFIWLPPFSILCKKVYHITQQFLNLFNVCLSVKDLFSKYHCWFIKHWCQNSNTFLILLYIVSVGWKLLMCKTVTFQDSNSKAPKRSRSTSSKRACGSDYFVWHCSMIKYYKCIGQWFSTSGPGTTSGPWGGPRWSPNKLIVRNQIDLSVSVTQRGYKWNQTGPFGSICTLSVTVNEPLIMMIQCRLGPPKKSKWLSPSQIISDGGPWDNMCPWWCEKGWKPLTYCRAFTKSYMDIWR